MIKPQDNSPKDDTLMFADEPPGKVPVVSPIAPDAFTLLIVDDEKEVHAMTRLVLKDYQYMGKGLEFISAFSGKEARQIILKEKDIACCLLDVVMESKEAGLEVARFIREDAANSRMRIILRTGQPGKAPEKEVILNYDINDYKEKTELTSQKLFTTVTTALRSYLHLLELEEKSREIQAKNIRLNEEIARRIVAESNLTKYNRSLERMIESKTRRLEKALNTLEATEKQLFAAQKTAIVPGLSSASLDTLEASSNLMDDNLKKMDLYRQQMTSLLEKYNTLERILVSHQDKQSRQGKQTRESVTEIQTYKTEINLEEILERYPEIIDDSQKGIKRISRTIRDIKTFISISDEPFVPLDINHTLRTVVKQLKETAPKTDFQLDLQNIPVVNLPEQNFLKALDHVLDNALNAVSNQGIIIVSTRYKDQSLYIRVSDIGMGISQQILPKIFIPYFKGWEKGGKGLGLSFAKSVMFSCGGDVTVQSTLNEGSTVSLIIPATG